MILRNPNKVVISSIAELRGKAQNAYSALTEYLDKEIDNLTDLLLSCSDPKDFRYFQGVICVLRELRGLL